MLSQNIHGYNQKVTCNSDFQLGGGGGGCSSCSSSSSSKNL